MQRVGDGRDLKWEARLQEALLNVELSFVPLIANPTLTIRELLKLRVDMVIDIQTFEQVKIYVEGEPLLVGLIGEQDGNLAVRIVG